jgi:DNA integrity scanning protein DisA with diadenylate cyclase activity
MVLGDESNADEHIRILGQIASVFSPPGALDRLKQCTDAGSLYRQLIETEPHVAHLDDTRTDAQNRAILEHAWQLSETLAAGAVIVLGPRHMSRYLRGLGRSGERLWLLAAPATPRDRPPEDHWFDAMISIPSRGLGGRQRVKVVVLIGLLNGLIGGEDVAICVYGREESHILDTVYVVDLRHQFRELLLVSHEIRDSDIEPEVLYRVLQLTNELAIEGREGNPVGTLFTLGDYEQVAQYTHQIVINPFRGYQADEKNILDPSLAETIKEFSLLDGAFVVRGDGEVMSAGVCVQIHTPADGSVSGLGTRHAAGVAISAATRALAIVLSQSTGTVSVYKSGRKILTLSRSRE